MRQSPYQFRFVWREPDPHLNDQVMAFWDRNHALSSFQDPAARLETLMGVALDSDRVVAVGSAEHQQIAVIETDMFNYRTFVDRDHRVHNLAGDLLEFVFNKLEAIAGRTPAFPSGVYTEVESHLLIKFVPTAIYQQTRLIFAGHTETGAQRRLRYFASARRTP